MNRTTATGAPTRAASATKRRGVAPRRRTSRTIRDVTSAMVGAQRARRDAAPSEKAAAAAVSQRAARRSSSAHSPSTAAASPSSTKALPGRDRHLVDRGARQQEGRGVGEGEDEERERDERGARPRLHAARQPHEQQPARERPQDEGDEHEDLVPDGHGEPEHRLDGREQEGRQELPVQVRVPLIDGVVPDRVPRRARHERVDVAGL